MRWIVGPARRMEPGARASDGCERAGGGTARGAGARGPTVGGRTGASCMIIVRSELAATGGRAGGGAGRGGRGKPSRAAGAVGPPGFNAGAPAAGRGAGPRNDWREGGGSSSELAGRMICVGSSSLKLGRGGRGSFLRSSPPPPPLPSFRFTRPSLPGQAAEGRQQATGKQALGDCPFRRGEPDQQSFGCA